MKIQQSVGMTKRHGIKEKLDCRDNSVYLKIARPFKEKPSDFKPRANIN